MSNREQSPNITYRLAFGPVHGLTDIGTVRASNEDNFLVDPDLGLVAVADGMGGHDGGEIAAWLALDALRSALGAAGDTPALAAAQHAVDVANAQVYQANLRAGQHEGEGMGTTLTGFWQQQPDAPLVVFHVGDSRLYRLRNGELDLLTRDHTLYQQALEAGVTGDYPPRNLLLQAIGPSSAVLADVQPCDVQAGDLYLLCSDGLYGNVPHTALAQPLRQANADTLDRCCAALVALAKQHGSRDNITAVLALVET